MIVEISGKHLKIEEYVNDQVYSNTQLPTNTSQAILTQFNTKINTSMTQVNTSLTRFASLYTQTSDDNSKHFTSKL